MTLDELPNAAGDEAAAEEETATMGENGWIGASHRCALLLKNWLRCPSRNVTSLNFRDEV